MNLQNDFSDEVRSLFLGTYKCWRCLQNGSETGGIQLHHTFGRISSSAFNCAPLCQVCHDKVTHSQEERRAYFRKTFIYLLGVARVSMWRPSVEDDKFIQLVFDAVSPELSTLDLQASR